MNGLLKSRKFWIAIVDAVLATLAIALGFFFKPEEVDQIMKLVLIWQGPILILLAAITVEDVAKLKAGVHPTQTGQK